MKKKLIIGLLAVGGVMALRPVIKRMVQKMREHREQMMGQFTGHSETAGQDATGPEALRQKMREHCEQMAVRDDEPSEAVATA